MSFARVCRLGVWFGFVRSALLLAVGTCTVLSFEAMPGLCCVLRVTPAAKGDCYRRNMHRSTGQIHLISCKKPILFWTGWLKRHHAQQLECECAKFCTHKPGMCAMHQSLENLAAAPYPLLSPLCDSLSQVKSALPLLKTPFPHTKLRLQTCGCRCRMPRSR